MLFGVLAKIFECELEESMSKGLQSSKQHEGQPVTRHAPLLLPTTAVTSSVIPRTLALIATISLVAFAFYMTRPETGLSSAEASGHAAQPQTPESGLPETGTGPSAQNQSQSNGGSAKNAVTVNGENIPVPDDGNLDRTIQDGDSTTTVHISSDGNGNSSSTVNVQSTSSSSSSSSSSSDSGT
jgi:hypothetical protein